MVDDENVKSGMINTAKIKKDAFGAMTNDDNMNIHAVLRLNFKRESFTASL